MIWAVIMAGGQGTRFWPLSTPLKPKQLLPIISKRTMVEETVWRLKGMVAWEQILIITNARQAKEIRRVLPKVPARNVIEEPCGRNTAPCIGLAAHIALSRDPEALLLILPADQVVTKVKTFQVALRKAVKFARRRGMHVTLGIKPTFPATGYGYIEAGKQIDSSTFFVKRFIEKPNLSRAKKFYRSRRFSWNSGMFIWRADTFLDSLKRYLPAVSSQLSKIAKTIDTAKFRGAMTRHFPRLPSISVDYGIMEKTPTAIVIRSNIDWSDVGSWDTAAQFWPKDRAGNAVKGAFLPLDARENSVLSESGQLVVGVGVKNLVIITTSKHVLVCDKSRIQDVRRIPDLFSRSRFK